MAVEPNIKQKADDIRSKIYGKEVRESLASGIEAISSSVVANGVRQNTVEDRQDIVESQWQQVIDETTGKDVVSAPEILVARKNRESSKVYASIGDRLDDENLFLTNQSLGRVSIVNFGAVCDGVTDDTVPFKEAIAYVNENGGELLVPGPTYITEPLVLNKKMKMVGYRNKTKVIKKNSNTFTDVDGIERNSVFILRHRHIIFDGVSVEGDIENNVNGFSFGEGASEFKIENLTIGSCYKAFDDYKECWVGNISNVNAVNCENAFVFTNDVEKTSLVFTNTWAENCGQAYAFYKMNYSSLISPAADWANYANEPSGYIAGFGNNATRLGVYDFELCRAVTITSGGAENCFGNGVIRVQASNVIVNGFISTNTQSTYEPSYVIYPNYAVGNIQVHESLSTLNINNVRLGSFENTFVNHAFPNKKIGVIAYNYNQGAYGVNNKKVVVVSGLSVLGNSIEVFNGMGDYLNDCLLIDDLGKNQSISKFIDFGRKRVFSSKSLAKKGGQTIRIPVKPQGDTNISYVISINGMSGESNSTNPQPFTGKIGFSSLDKVNNATLIDGSGGIVVTGNLNYLDITLPNPYDSILFDLTVLSNSKHYVLYDDISFV